MFSILGVSPWRHTAALRRVLTAFALAIACCATNAAAADPAPNDKPAAEKAAPAPSAVPLSEIGTQAEAATVALREIAASTANDPLPAIEKQLPAFTREVDARARENAGIVAQRPTLEFLRSLERSWGTVRTTLAEWNADVDARLAALDRDLARLNELEAIWKQTRAVIVKEQAPTELAERADYVLATIAKTRKPLETQRAAALRVQVRLASLDYKLNEALGAIEQARGSTLTRIFTRDSPALWNRDWSASAGERIAVGSQEAREAQFTTLQAYAERRSDRILIHGALFAVLCAVLYWARRRLLAWAKEDPGVAHPADVVAYPIATALVLTLILSRWFYPQAPRLMWAIIGAAALVPTVLVLRRIAAPYLLPLLYAVLVFFFIDQVRMVTASIELVPRLLFLAEMVGGTAFLLWFLRTMKPGTAETPAPKYSRLVRLGVQVACALFAVTALANAAGYVSLGNLLGNAVLRSMNYGLILYTVVEILDALIAIALRVWPLTIFGMVRRHRELLRRRARMLLNGAALLIWTLFALDRLALRERVIGTLSDALAAELEIGAISISLGDVVAFVLAVWASFLVSRFVQFVLDEEVYPHAKLKRGLPYAISRTVHYSILVAGFFVAMGVIGVDMTKFTILAGAFTVGVGFGLQNIFNNFVSGLILLFERPVQVGDVIQIDDTSGVVERIGIRASVVRTINGSEVIVPNGKLISERLINWTFSEHQRGLDVGVSVVLGSDPTRVIQILEGVAGEHPKVLKKPPPEALLTRVGPDWMGFELRAATDQVEDWMRVRSDLAVALTSALKAANVTLR